MEIDRLSELPNHLLVDILNRLYNTQEAAKTAVLSKQWRFLWMSVPLLIFSDFGKKEKDEIRRFLARVHAAVDARRNSTLDYCSLSLYLHYSEVYASELEGLLDFAAKSCRLRDVELTLPLLGYKGGGYPTLPQTIYSHSSLTRLSLWSFNVVTPATTVEWPFMTELELNCVNLPQHAMDKIASGCPALTRLELYICRGFNRLDVGGRSFRELQVTFCHGLGYDQWLEISAPYMRDLVVWINPGERSLRLTDVSSLDKVDIQFFLSLYKSLDSISQEEMLANSERLFQQLVHVRSFVLNDGWLEVLSMMRSEGWQFPQSRVEHLQIKDSFDAHNISIILDIFESSPFLDKLDICNASFEKKDINWDPSVDADLKCDLLHLKTVQIDVYVDPKLSNELTFTLAQILLKRAPVLEKMVIRKKMANHIDMSDDSTQCTELIEEFETLLTYPKSSQKALVHVDL